DKEEDMTYLETSLNPFGRGSAIEIITLTSNWHNASVFPMKNPVGLNAIGYKFQTIIGSSGYNKSV
ncbi:3141_t:CDS:2, partial [Funneliformis geosporum]